MSLETPAASTEATTTEEPPRVGIRFTVLFVLAMFGIWMSINLPASVTVALRVSEIDPENKASVYSLVAGIGTLVAVLANPFFGRLSDRTRSRFGRRRPWIVVGILGTAVGAAVIGLSDTVPLLIVGWVLMQAFVNAAIAPTLAIVADRVPESQQGFIGSLSAMASSTSVVVGIFFVQAFPTSILAQIGLPVVAALVFGLLFVLRYRDDRPAAGSREPFSVRDFLGSFYVNPKTNREFCLFLTTFFLLGCSGGVGTTYTVYYLQDKIQVAEDQLPGVLMLAYLVPGVVNVIVAPLCGWLGDKLGRRKPLMFGSAIIAAAGIGVIVTSTGVVQFLVGLTLVTGLSIGILLGSYVALAIGTMPNLTDAARNLGLVNMAGTLPYSLVPFAAPILLSVGGGTDNYVLLFLVAGIVSLLSIVPLTFIRSVR